MSCFRLFGKAAPNWLKLQTRYGRAPALRAEKLRALQPHLAHKRDLFQTLMLLRDSDLRALWPHRVEPVALPSGTAPVATFRQAKIGDGVRLPLPRQPAWR